MKQPKLTAIIKSRRLTLFGHIMRMDDNADAKRIPVSPPPADWRRQPGRPHITKLSTVQQDLKHHHLTLPKAADLAQNRPLWSMKSTYGAKQSYSSCMPETTTTIQLFNDDEALMLHTVQSYLTSAFHIRPRLLYIFSFPMSVTMSTQGRLSETTAIGDNSEAARASHRTTNDRRCTARLERPACRHHFCTVTSHFQAVLEDSSVWTVIRLTTDLVTCPWSFAYSRIKLSLIIIITHNKPIAHLVRPSSYR